VPPPYGIGSLGFIVSSTDKIDFGNETDFARLPVRDLTTLKYWLFTGADSMAGLSLPGISIEVDPRIVVSGNPVTYASLNYVPSASAAPSAPVNPSPNTWQHYDAAAEGGKWYATGATGTAIGCTFLQPCSFARLKAGLPDAVISYSLGFTKGRDTAFVGAVDGLQVNRAIYDFEPLGVFRIIRGSS
jgi:hypothetical protein